MNHHREDFSRKVSLTTALLVLLGLSLYSAPVLRGAEITVDVDKRYQTIEGFGTCLIRWTGQMRKLYATEKFADIYANKLGCSMLRCDLQGRIMMEPVEDWREIRWQDFDVDNPMIKVFYDFGRAIRQLNPEIKIIGTVWTPPPWMKVDGTYDDKRSAAIPENDYRGFRNRVKPEYYKHYARWLAEVVKMFEAKGAPLYAVSPGNEVRFTQTFSSCVWTAEDYAKIVRILGETLDEEGLDDVMIYGPETMTHRPNTRYLRCLVDDPEVAKHFDVFATHGYVMGFEAEMEKSSSARFWNSIKDYGRPYWVTEGGTGGHEWPQPLMKGVATAIHNSLVAGNASAFVPWQIAEQKPSTHALMVMDQFTPKTYAAAHYFKYIRPGAVRIDAAPAYGKRVQASAYLHSEKHALTVVLLNPSNEEEVVTIGFRQQVPFRSMGTFRTSDSEQLKELSPTPVQGNKLSLTMPPLSIVTLYEGAEAL